MIPAVAIVGKSKSGKTTAIEKLIAEFKSRGFRVAAVKHAHQTVELDIPGKDTARFAQAGSDACVVSSPSRLTVFKNASREPSVEEVLSSLGNEYDIAIIEGFKRSKLPRIEVFRSELGKDMVCAPEELAAVITDKTLPFDLPQFRSDNVKGIADFVEREMLNNIGSDIAVFANGKQVFMKPFVKEIIANAILAMIGALKNTGIIKNASISIRSKR